MRMLSTGIIIILFIVVMLGIYHDTNPNASSSEFINKTISTVDSNISKSFSTFKDMNVGDTDDSNNFGNAIYHLATGIKHDFYSMAYIGALVYEHMPWIYQNWFLILVLIILFMLAPVLAVLAMVIVGIILWVKDTFVHKKEKINGVWEK